VIFLLYYNAFIFAIERIVQHNRIKFIHKYNFFKRPFCVIFLLYYNAFIFAIERIVQYKM